LSTSVGKPCIDISKLMVTCSRRAWNTASVLKFMRMLMGELKNSTLIMILGMLYVYYLVIVSGSLANLLRVHTIFLPQTGTHRKYRRKSPWAKYMRNKARTWGAATERAMDRWAMHVQYYLGANRKSQRARRRSRFANNLLPKRGRVLSTTTTEQMQALRRSLCHRVLINRSVHNKRAVVRKHKKEHKQAHARYKNTSTNHEVHAMITTTNQMERNTKERSPQKTTKSVLFDTDSCSYSMSGVERDFVPGTIKPVKVGMSVGTYGGMKVPITGTGTIQWTTLDDTGQKIVMIIPRSFYVKGTKTRLLSPQHYAQVARVPETGKRCEVLTTIHGTKLVMQWKERKTRKTIPLDNANLGTIHTVSGYTVARALFANANYSEDIINTQSCCYECTVSEANTPKNEGDDSKNEGECDVMFENNKHEVSGASAPQMFENNRHEVSGASAPKEQNSNEKSEKQSTIRSDPVELQIGSNVFHDTIQQREHVLDEAYIETSQPEHALLLLHYKFGHAPMKRLQRLAERGILPRQLAKCPIPICQSCIFGKMTRKPWRSKPMANPPTRKAISRPGEVVSVDQLESPIEGFLAQEKGKLTKRRYRAATIFVDNYSSLSYVHLQQSVLGDETLLAKRAFEQ
jgi:GAG-pre-integrase domain